MCFEGVFCVGWIRSFPYFLFFYVFVGRVTVPMWRVFRALGVLGVFGFVFREIRGAQGALWRDRVRTVA